MGYRSQVAYAIQFKDIQTMQEILAVIMATEPKLHEAVKECKVDAEDALLIFETDGVKWYDSFEDVQSHNELREWMSEHFPEVTGWVFTRIGEELDDVVWESDGHSSFTPYDVIDIRRCIDMGVDHNALPYFEDIHKLTNTNKS